MFTGIQHFHSYWAYIVLITLLIATIYHLIGFTSKQTWSKGHKVTASLGMIFSHIQLLLGLILYIISPYGISNFSSETMSNSLHRLYAIEHPLINIIAIILITWGYSRSKKLVGSPAAFKSIFMFYGIAFLLILSRIPWQSWP